MGLFLRLFADDGVFVAVLSLSLPLFRSGVHYLFLALQHWCAPAPLRAWPILRATAIARNVSILPAGRWVVVFAPSRTRRGPPSSQLLATHLSIQGVSTGGNAPTQPRSDPLAKDQGKPQPIRGGTTAVKLFRRRPYYVAKNEKQKHTRKRVPTSRNNWAYVPMRRGRAAIRCSVLGAEDSFFSQRYRV